MQEQRERSVRNLQELYTVAVSVSLALAIEHLVREGAGFPIEPAGLGPLAAFLFTLVPFYHGAMRHLDSIYIEERGKEMRRGALLGDFSLLFVEGCLFLTMANLLYRPIAFAWTLVVLLVFDAVWGTLTHVAFARHPQPRTQLRWVLINSVAAPALAYWLIFTNSGLRTSELSWLLAVFAAIRTTIDYYESWNFYFPPADRSGS